MGELPKEPIDSENNLMPIGQDIGNHNIGIRIAEDFDFELNIVIRLLLRLYCKNGQFLKEAHQIQLQLRNQIPKEANLGQYFTDNRGAFQILTSGFKTLLVPNLSFKCRFVDATNFG